jgi:hypothetical protein
MRGGGERVEEEEEEKEEKMRWSHHFPVEIEGG